MTVEIDGADVWKGLAYLLEESRRFLCITVSVCVCVTFSYHINLCESVPLLLLLHMHFSCMLKVES
jgi:diacylglycerol kinase